MTLIAVGDMADKLVSWSAFTTSPDGELWTLPTRPFADRCKAVGVAYGLDKFVAISDAGFVSSSIDGIDWNSEQLVQCNVSPSSIAFANGKFAIAGQRKFLVAEGPYEELDEAAQIFINDTGNNREWRLIYSYFDSNNSRFYGIRYIADAPEPVWVALGSSQGKPFGIYSKDDCETWNEIEFPEFSKLFAAYDIIWNDDRFYISASNLILNTPTLENPVWDASQVLSVPYGISDLVRIEKNPAGHMVAVCSGGIFYSLDRTGWALFRQAGYRYKSITWYNDAWYASADSNLTTYTYWTSSNTVDWTSYYQTVQIYGFTEI